MFYVSIEDMLQNVKHPVQKCNSSYHHGLCRVEVHQLAAEVWGLVVLVIRVCLAGYRKTLVAVLEASQLPRVAHHYPGAGNRFLWLSQHVGGNRPPDGGLPLPSRVKYHC